MSYRDVKNVEEQSTPEPDSVNSLESMFAYNRSQSINHASI
jgi:hypothetical protein